MYKEMAETAREEGFEKLAFLFDGVGKIEKEHEERYLTLLKNLEEGVVFKRGDEYVWKCRNCGHIHFGKTAPEVCPICAIPGLFRDPQHQLLRRDVRQALYKAGPT